MMAYALGLPASVTDLVYFHRDWRFEEIRKSNGTPTALAIKDLLNHDANELQVNEAISEGEEVDYERPNGYAYSLRLASFCWHAALEETHREDIMRQFYFSAEL